MSTSTISPVKGSNKVSLKGADKRDLIAVARGMKKDGFADTEIAEATKLSLSFVNSLVK